MSKRSPLAVVAVCALCLVTAGSAHAGFTTFMNPDAAYLAAAPTLLTRVPPGTPTFTTVSMLAGGGATATLSVPSSYRIAPGGGWGTWAAMPFSERTPTGTIDVYFHTTSTQSITLTAPPGMAITTAGLEYESNAFGVFDLRADFFTSAGLEGTIMRPVDGSAGSRLFAGMSTDVPTGFSRIDLTVPPGALGAAFGALRIGVAGVGPPPGPGVIPEPSSLALLGIGFAGALGYGLRRRLRASPPT